MHPRAWHYILPFWWCKRSLPWSERLPAPLSAAHYSRWPPLCFLSFQWFAFGRASHITSRPLLNQRSGSTSISNPETNLSRLVASGTHLAVDGDGGLADKPA